MQTKLHHRHSSNILHIEFVLRDFMNGKNHYVNTYQPD